MTVFTSMGLFHTGKPSRGPLLKSNKGVSSSRLRVVVDEEMTDENQGVAEDSNGIVEESNRVAEESNGAADENNGVAE